MLLFNRTFILLFSTFAIFLLYVSIPSYSKMGMIYFKDNRYDLAYENLLKAGGGDIKNIFALKTLKDYYIIEGKYDKALNIQIKLSSMKPKNLDYLLELKKLYEWNDLYYESIQTREKIWRLEAPKLSKSNFILEAVAIINEYQWLNKYPDVERLFAEFKQDPNKQIEFKRLQFYLQTKNDEKALAYFREYEQKQKLSRDMLLSRAQVYSANKNYVSAINDYFRMLSSNINEFSPSTRIQALWQNDKYKDFLSRKKMMEDNSIIYTISDLMRRGKLFERKEAFLKHLHLGYFRLYDISMMYPELLLEQKRFEEADPLLQKYEIKHERILNTLIGMYYSYENIPGIVRCYEILVSIRPRNIKYHKELGEIYESLNEKQKAIKIYQKILKIENSSTFVKRLKKIFITVKTIFQGAMAKELDKTKQQIKRELANEKRKKDFVEIREKLINLYEEVGEDDKANALAAETYQKYQNNFKALKLYVKTLLSEQKIKEVYYILNEFQGKKDKNDPEYLELKVIYYEAFERYEDVIKILNKKERNEWPDWYYRSYEEGLFKRENKSDHERFCKQFSYQEKSKKLHFVRIKCLYRTGKKANAHQDIDSLLISKSLVKEQERELLTLKIEYLLIDNQIFEAKNTFNKLKTNYNLTKYNKEQEKNIIERIKVYNKNNAYRLDLSYLYYNSSSIEYNHTDLQLSKGFKYKYRFGLGTRNWFMSRPSNSFKQFYLRGTYLQNDSINYNLIIPIISGDKNYSILPYEFVYNNLLNSTSFLSLSSTNSSPEISVTNLINDSSSRRSSHNAYFEKMWNKSYHSDHNINISQITSVFGDADIISLTTDVHRLTSKKSKLLPNWLNRLERKHHFHFETITKLGYSKLSTDSPTLNDLFIDSSLTYGLGLKIENDRTRNRTFIKTLDWSALISTSGDLERGISFGGIKQLRLELDYYKNTFSYIRTFIELSEESLTNASENIFRAGFELRYTL